MLKIFLQGGQSNSDGRAKTNGLPVRLLEPQPDVPVYYSVVGDTTNADGTYGTLTTLQPGFTVYHGGTFGPELAFGRTVADYYAVSNGVSTNQVMVALIKYAAGGTSLYSKWQANGTASKYSPPSNDGPNYRMFQDVVHAGLSKLAAVYSTATLELEGMIWVQGESDIDLGAGACLTYGTNLENFIKDVRLTFGGYSPYGTNFPFYFSRISANQTVYSTPTDPDYSNYLLLRAGQAYAAASLTNVFILDTDGPQFSTLTPYSSPGLHFDTAGQVALGTALANLVHAAIPRPSIQKLEHQSTGWQVSFTGATDTRHDLEWAPGLDGPWTTVANIVMNSSGQTNYTDAVFRGDIGFYRVSRP